MSCPPCRGDCQQGRECPARNREPSLDDIAVLMLAVATAIAMVVVAWLVV